MSVEEDTFPPSPQDVRAALVVRISVEVEQEARRMRSGIMDPAYHALAIVELLKQLLPQEGA